MRRLYFLLPGTTRQFACGGLFAELKTVEMVQQVCPAEVVTYRQREPNTPFLEDILQAANHQDSIFVLSWGFDVPRLAQRLRSHNLVYHAHSTHYGFRLAAGIPILAVSRHTMGYWGQQAPNGLIYYLPNQISKEFCLQNQVRDIDVLVQTRKTSTYVKTQLIPRLQLHCRVEVVDRFVDDLAGLFNRAKVYLYDSAEYWAMQGVTEGFGLPPLEALACGCQVFSSVNSALADYLDPEFNCYKLAGYATEYDVQRILQVLANPTLPPLPESFWQEYRSEAIVERLHVILPALNSFFDYRQHHQADIPALTPLRITRLRAGQAWQKLHKKLFS